MSHDFSENQWTSPGRIIPGIILVGLGTLFLLDNLQIVYFRDWIRYWPAILIAISIVKLVDSTTNEGRVVAGILLALGGALLASTLGLVSLRLGDLWPLVLIGVGLFLLLQRTVLGRPGAGGSSGPRMDEVAVFGGGKRVANNFEGGRLSAFCGGFEVDLRKAAMSGDATVLEIHCMFGGASLRIPENWHAQIEGSAIFGGWGDNTEHPDLNQPGVKRLILRGVVVFGGVEIKN